MRMRSSYQHQQMLPIYVFKQTKTPTAACLNVKCLIIRWSMFGGDGGVIPGEQIPRTPAADHRNARGGTHLILLNFSCRMCGGRCAANIQMRN